MFFGVGIGILAMILITFIAYVIQRSAYINEAAGLQMLLQQALEDAANFEIETDDLVELARGIGMIFPDEYEIDAIESEENYEEQNMDFLENEDEQSDIFEEIEEPEELALIEQETIQVIEPPPTPPPTPMPTPQPTPEPTPTPSPALPPEIPETPELSEPTITEPAPEGMAWVDIPVSANATDVSAILESEGIISSREEFLFFLIENGYTRRILDGRFSLPLDGDFEEIIRTILSN